MQKLRWLELGTFDKLRFDLEFESLNDDAMLRDLEWLLLEPEEGSATSHELVNVLQSVLDRAPELSRASKDTRVEVFVSVFCIGQEILDKLKAFTARNGGWRFPIYLPCHEGFSLECSVVLELRVSLGRIRKPQDYQCVVERASTDGGGFTIDNFAFNIAHFDAGTNIELNGSPEGGEEDEAIVVQTLGRVFKRVFCASGCSLERLPFLNEVEITHENYPTPSSFARLCSAVANCKRTSKFTVRMSDIRYESEDDESTTRDRKWIWQCMAYALFSSYARAHSAISSAKIVWNSMTLEDVAGVGAILSSTDATRLVYDRNSQFISNGDQDVKMLKQGANLKVEPLDEDYEDISAGTARWELGTDVHGVQILHDEPGNSDAMALVPGYGVCSVARDALMPSPPVLKMDNPVTRLAIRSEWYNDFSCLPDFLQVVGSPLTYLSIKYFSDEIPVQSILNACPNLKTLILKGKDINTHTFLQAYQTSGVHLEDLNCCFDDECLLMDDLKDKTKSLSRTLKGLTCYTSQWRDYDRSLESLREMLKVNEVLEFLHIAVYLDEHLVNIQIDFIPDVHNKSLPIARSPLSMKCRLAFISLFSPSSRPSIGNPAKRMRRSSGYPLLLAFRNRPVTRLRSLAPLSGITVPPDVFARIFDFAAPNVLRRVCAGRER